jgi:glucan phosphorylase
MSLCPSTAAASACWLAGDHLKTASDLGLALVAVGLLYIQCAIRALGWRFNTDRMLRDYVLEYYLPSAGVHSCAMRK